MKSFAAVLIPVSLLSIVGCQSNVTDPDSAAFEPNYVYANVVERVNDLDEGAMKEPLKKAFAEVTDLFGTPNEPKIPAVLADGDYKDLLSIDKLRSAAGLGITGKEPGKTGLYQQFCYNCHGETGQGRGTVAASQNPYPRDFRRGLFKYKSTPRNSKPTHADLVQLVASGLPGTQMPVFKEQLNAEQIEAVTQYAKYLSIRGELERRILAAIAEEEEYDAKELVTEIADSWIEAEEAVVEATPPADLPVEGLTENIDPVKLAESIERGRKVFMSDAAACAQCHGETGRGDGKKEPDYDDWTKEWTKQIQVNPADPEEIAPFLAMGAMKPQVMIVRNLREGKFRGGRDPLDLYRRIRFGIAGATMPAASIVDSPDQPGVTEADIWHMVNYLRSIAGTDAETQATPPAAKTAAQSSTQVN